MPTPLTPEQALLIDMWLSDLDIPQPDAGHEAWRTETVVTSMVTQLYDRLTNNGFTVSHEALTDHVLGIIRDALSRR